MSVTDNRLHPQIGVIIPGPHPSRRVHAWKPWKPWNSGNSLPPLNAHVLQTAITGAELMVPSRDKATWDDSTTVSLASAVQQPPGCQNKEYMEMLRDPGSVLTNKQGFNSRDAAQ